MSERAVMTSSHPQSLSPIMGLGSSMNNTRSSQFLLRDTKVLVHKSAATPPDHTMHTFCL